MNPDSIANYFSKPGNEEVYIPVEEGQFAGLTGELARQEAVLTGLFCAENFGWHAGFTLFYVFEKRGAANIVIFLRRLAGETATSIGTIFPAAIWFEREIQDGFGVNFPDAPDKRRLFLHEGYPADFHPLRKDFRNQPVETSKVIKPEQEYKFKEMQGEGVYQIPVGPVHAGIIEPGHFRFSVIGETILNLEIRMFYKHRGIEKLAEGKTPQECVRIAETISGDETAANATAYCMAVEKICGTTVPVRAWQIRTVLLELERIYSHLGDLAGMILDAAYPTGAAKFFVLREEILRWNNVLTGSRFLKNTLKVGGLQMDIPDRTLKELSGYLEGFGPRCSDGVKTVKSHSSVVDRLETTGVIRKDLVRALNITGPAARAAGIPIDTRCHHPYGIYATTAVCDVGTGDAGDVMSRFDVKADEIADSVEMCRNIIAGIQGGDISAAVTDKDGYALSLVESPRGQTMFWVCIHDGAVDRFKVRTASFCNWQAIEHAVLGNIVPDFPLINKSLNLSYAGTDL